MVLSDERRALALDITQSLVRIESLAGHERLMAEETREWMENLGFDDVRVDNCGSVFGTMHGGDGATVLFDSHIDTVPAGDRDGWTKDPFSGAVVGDRVYGRGTSDMKGALAASIAAAVFAKQDGTLRGTVVVAGSVGEEHIEGLALGHTLDEVAPDLVIICEASELKLNTAQRGRAEIMIDVHGKSAHASSPHLGVNAFRNMSILARELDALTPPSDAQLGQGILEPTQVITTPYPNVSVIPWMCRAHYDRRTLVGETADDVLAPIHAAIAELTVKDSDFNADAKIVPGEFICYTGLKLEQDTFAPAWRMDEDSAWVRAARHALDGVELGHYSFCTNGSYTLGRAGIPTLGYGPGYEASAHITDEYLDLEQLYGAVEGYYKLMGMGTV